ncbi:MAG: hypothetical protein WCT04_24320 [Planctomycetota bacterium]
MQLSIGDELVDALKLAYAAKRPVLLSGNTGIGKSQIAERAAKDLGIGFIARDLSLMEAPELAGMPITTGGELSYAIPKFLPKTGSGFIVFEELNRSPRHVRVPALELLTRWALNDYALPPGWLPMACINPPGADYDVEELDPALLARFSVLSVKADVKCWLRWAESSGVHPAVREYVRSTPKIFDTRESNPRAWSFVSNLVHAHESGNGTSASLLALIIGQIGEKLGPAFVKFYGTFGKVKLPTPEEILNHYPRHRLAIRRVRDDGNTAALHSVSQQMLLHLQDPTNQRTLLETKTRLVNYHDFVSDLPAEYRARFQKNIDRFLKKGA